MPPKIKVRKVRISDLPQLADKLEHFYSVLLDKGAKDISPDKMVLKGGVLIEIGNGYYNPDFYCIVAEDTGTGFLDSFMIGLLEHCGPVESESKRVRVHALYINNDSLVGPRLVVAMWNELEKWARETGAGYFYANIHPGNQPSVKAAKACGFKHHYTQFYRPINLPKEEIK